MLLSKIFYLILNYEKFLIRINWIYTFNTSIILIFKTWQTILTQWQLSIIFFTNSTIIINTKTFQTIFTTFIATNINEIFLNNQ